MVDIAYANVAAHNPDDYSFPRDQQTTKYFCCVLIFSAYIMNREFDYEAFVLEGGFRPPACGC